MNDLHSLIVAVCALLGLHPPGVNVYQGYGEGDYVLVSPQVAGRIETLDVARGQQVHKGDTLFTLEHTAEQEAVDQAKAAADHARAALADLLKAKRQPELDQLVASRDAAAAALQIARINVDRDEKQLKVQAVSQSVYDNDKAQLEQAKAKLAESEAALATGQLTTGRDDAIHAAQADVAAADAAEAQAEWKLNEKKIVAASDAYVFDTIYRTGEYVNAGQAVVSLLPPQNIKVRFFVSGLDLPRLKAGQVVTIRETGVKETMPAHITYVSPQAEYSPPELYNRDNRDKLLFMLEAVPDAQPERIHPGLPVDVIVDQP